MHGKSERYEIGGSVVTLQVGVASAHITAPAGHVDGARKIIDLLKHTLYDQGMGFHLREHETTAHFSFGEAGASRKKMPDGDVFRNALTSLSQQLPDANALSDAHQAMCKSWAHKAQASPVVQALQGRS